MTKWLDTMKGEFHMMKKSLLILFTAASIALSGCGQNSAATPVESSTKVEGTKLKVQS